MNVFTIYNNEQLKREKDKKQKKKEINENTIKDIRNL